MWCKNIKKKNYCEIQFRTVKIEISLKWIQIDYYMILFYKIITISKFFIEYIYAVYYLYCYKNPNNIVSYIYIYVHIYWSNNKKLFIVSWWKYLQLIKLFCLYWNNIMWEILDLDYLDFVLVLNLYLLLTIKRLKTRNLEKYNNKK